jgi:hypothetical protein
VIQKVVRRDPAWEQATLNQLLGRNSIPADFETRSASPEGGGRSDGGRAVPGFVLRPRLLGSSTPPLSHALLALAARAVGVREDVPLGAGGQPVITFCSVG